jgi:peptidoglycan/LPS O-acetylase OafA/YrhL
MGDRDSQGLEPVQTIIAIQVLRALAAVAVAVSHFQFDLQRTFGLGAALPPLGYGNAGVDLFFVISGFVMVYASEPLFGRRDGPGAFFMRRLIRIVPIYWLVTTLYIVLAFTLPGHKVTYSAQHIVASYLFIPWPRLDGVMQPVVGQGWTLNYEMLFYAVFALAVLAPRRMAVTLVALALGVAVLIGALISLPEPLAFWCDPMLLEFVFGMGLGLAYREGVRLPPLVGWLLILAGLVGFALAPWPAWGYSGTRFLTWGLPAVLMVAGAGFGQLCVSRRWQPLVLLGEASYALYLLHSIPVRAVLQGAGWAKLDIAAAPWFYLALATAGAIALAILVHLAFERPVTRALRRRAGSAAVRADALVIDPASPKT